MHKHTLLYETEDDEDNEGLEEDNYESDEEPTLLCWDGKSWLPRVVNKFNEWGDSFNGYHFLKLSGLSDDATDKLKKSTLGTFVRVSENYSLSCTDEIENIDQWCKHFVQCFPGSPGY